MKPENEQLIERGKANGIRWKTSLTMEDSDGGLHWLTRSQTNSCVVAYLRCS